MGKIILYPDYRPSTLSLPYFTGGRFGAVCPDSIRSRDKGDECCAIGIENRTRLTVVACHPCRYPLIFHMVLEVGKERVLRRLSK